MIFQNAELHNIADLVEVEQGQGLRMQRVPETTRQRLLEGAQGRVLAPSASEIRFVIEEGKARVTLSQPEGVGTIFVMFGPYHYRETFALAPEPTTIELELPERVREVIERRPETPYRFAPSLCRLLLPMREADVRIHSIEGNIRPPKKEETPDLTLLTYGTSITHGGDATAPYLSYASQTAWRLGADHINLGVGGACMCEEAFTEHIAERDDWDFASFCLSVNMLNRGTPVEEFYERAEYLVRRTLETDRPVAAFSILPWWGDWEEGYAERIGPVDAYRSALREIMEKHESPRTLFIEGPELMPDIGGLSVDLLHPSDHGMTQISENLAARLRPFLRGLGYEVR